MSTSTLKLYEHADAIQVVEDWILEHDEEIRAAGGALPDELAQLLEGAQLGFREKVEGVALVILGMKATAAAIKEEEARLAARRKHFDNAAAGLTNYLHAQLERAGERKVEGLRATVAIQNSPPSVVGDLSQAMLAILCESGSEIAVRVPETYRLDRKAALDKLKSGVEIAGLAIEQGTHVRIR